MELRQIRYFIAVAEALNISEAARRLQTSQPSLGRQIQALEEEIAVQLFGRRNRRLTLTRAGEIFLQKCKTIVSDIDDAVVKARISSLRNRSGITIGYVPPATSKIFPLFLPFLSHQQPDICPILRSIDSDEQIASLKDNSIDIGFLRKNGHDDALLFDEVIRESLVVLLPAAHPLSGQSCIAPKDLACLPFLPSSPSLCRQIRTKLGPLPFLPESPSVEAGNDNLFDLLGLVGAGLGFTLLTDFVQDFVPPAVAVRALDLPEPVEIPLYVAHRKNDRSEILADFLKSLREWIRQREPDRR